MNSNTDQVSLNIKAATWTKETNDLFDFDTKDIYTSEVKTIQPVFIVNLSNFI